MYKTTNNDFYKLNDNYRDYYYPSYPSYRINDDDKGSKAFSIIKHLIEKKLIKVDEATTFISLMEELMKIL